MNPMKVLAIIAVFAYAVYFIVVAQIKGFFDR
jgi:hypothetical protein